MSSIPKYTLRQGRLRLDSRDTNAVPSGSFPCRLSKGLLDGGVTGAIYGGFKAGVFCDFSWSNQASRPERSTADIRALNGLSETPSTTNWKGQPCWMIPTFYGPHIRCVLISLCNKFLKSRITIAETAAFCQQRFQSICVAPFMETASYTKCSTPTMWKNSTISSTFRRSSAKGENTYFGASRRAMVYQVPVHELKMFW